MTNEKMSQFSSGEAIHKIKFHFAFTVFILLPLCKVLCAKLLPRN